MRGTAGPMRGANTVRHGPSGICTHLFVGKQVCAVRHLSRCKYLTHQNVLLLWS